MIARDAVATLTSPVLLVHLLALAGTLAVYTYVQRRRSDRIGSWFCAWTGTAAAWITLNTAGAITVDHALRLALESAAIAMLPVASASWLGFAVVYSGYWHVFSDRLRAGIAVVTVVLVALAFTNPVHGLIATVSQPTETAGVAVVTVDAAGVGYWLLLAIVYVQYLGGVGLLVTQLGSRDRRSRRQILAIVGGITFPLAVGLCVATGVLSSTPDPTPPSVAISVVGIAYAVLQPEGLEDYPGAFRVGERVAIEAADQGIVVQDLDGCVVLANPAAEDLLEGDHDSLVGRDVETVLAGSSLEPVGEAGTSDPTTDWDDGTRLDGVVPDDVDGRTTQTLQDRETGQVYEVHCSRIESTLGPTIGQTLFFREVTGDRRRKERLRVLNRILRHNLRNDMTVLQGHVDLLREDVEDQEAVATIERVASDLAELGETAHRLDRVFDEAQAASTPVNVAAVVERVVERRQECVETPIVLRGAVQAWTETNATLVETITASLLENALQRTGESREQVATAQPATASDAVTWTSEETLAEPRGDASSDARRDASSDATAYPSSVSEEGSRSRADGGADRSHDGLAGGVPTVKRYGEQPDADDEPVVVEVRAADHQVTITVVDDGPPIGERDLERLLRGEVSALGTANGSHLWAVQCCVDVADATWAVDSGARTAITVRFPAESELQTAATGAPGSTVF